MKGTEEVAPKLLVWPSQSFLIQVHEVIVIVSRNKQLLRNNTMIMIIIIIVIIIMKNKKKLTSWDIISTIMVHELTAQFKLQPKWAREYYRHTEMFGMMERSWSPNLWQVKWLCVWLAVVEL